MNRGPGGGPCCGRSDPQVRPLESELLAQLCSFLPVHSSQTRSGWGSGMASHICNPRTLTQKENQVLKEEIRGVSGRNGATKQPLPPRPRVWGLPVATSSPTAASWGFPCLHFSIGSRGPYPPLLSAFQDSFLTVPVTMRPTLQDLPPLLLRFHRRLPAVPGQMRSPQSVLHNTLDLRDLRGLSRSFRLSWLPPFT